jgi:hypothetical protein
MEQPGSMIFEDWKRKPQNRRVCSSRICRMFSTPRKRLLPVLLAPLLLFACGCGRSGANRGAVSGTVKLDGKPVEQGSILFTPIEGARGSVAGGEIENGRYQLSAKKGPAIGWNRVEIQAMRKTGKMVRKAFGRPGEMVPEQVSAIPPRFNTKSKLKAEIKPGDNTADFDVSSRE